METVAPRGKQKRFGDGESLKPVHRQSKITPELQAEQTVGRAGFPPLSGTHIVVCSNRWEIETLKAFFLLQEKGLFLS